MEVPYDPQRIAVIDMACLDIIDALGLGDRVVGTAASQIEYLQDYMDNETIANLGTLKSPDAEAVMECRCCSKYLCKCRDNRFCFWPGRQNRCHDGGI